MSIGMMKGTIFSGLATQVSIFPQILGLVASDIGVKELGDGDPWVLNRNEELFRVLDL